jgi:CDP-glycerol glycerophosphotransferase (TagB/SpsB family)
MFAKKKKILFFAKAPNNVIAFKRISDRLEQDPRLELWFCGEYLDKRNPRHLYQLFNMEGERLIGRSLCQLKRFDIYISPDIMMVGKRARIKIHMFHGVSFKGKPYSEKVFAYDKLFIVGEDMRRRFIQRGILRQDDSRIEKIGMPKTDPLVDGSLNRTEIFDRLRLDASRKTVLYAPTWRPESSLYSIGAELMRELARLDLNLLVKLHDLVYDTRVKPAGGRQGIDWAREIRRFETDRVRVIRDYDIVPYLFVADVLISDASSAANEFLLLDRPIIFIDVPALIAKYKDTIDLETWGRQTGTTVSTVPELLGALEEAFAEPLRLRDVRRAAAADIFYNPGRATARALETIYQLLEMPPTA